TELAYATLLFYVQILMRSLFVLPDGNGSGLLMNVGSDIIGFHEKAPFGNLVFFVLYQRMPFSLYLHEFTRMDEKNTEYWTGIMG
ncbi:hypothetical protein ACFL02_04210, partial [Planctomycetota bacterium]